MAQSMAQQARLVPIDGWFRQQLGHSANEELTRAYGLPNAMLDSWGGPQEQAMSADTLMTQLQPSMAALGMSGGGWNRYPQQPQTHFAPQQGYMGWPQQANVFQFSAASQQNAYAPFNATAPATAPAPAPAPVSTPAPAPAPANPVRPHYLSNSADRTWVPTRIHARPAQVYLDSDQSIDAPSAGPSNWYAGPPVQVKYASIDVSDLRSVGVEVVKEEAPFVDVVEVSHAAVEIGPHPLSHDVHVMLAALNI
ncbi:hypothetical protein E4U58_004779, partial [Claviceps cyperi]